MVHDKKKSEPYRQIHCISGLEGLPDDTKFKVMMYSQYQFLFILYAHMIWRRYHMQVIFESQ